MNRLEYIPGDLVTYNGNIVTIENSDGYYATYYDEDECLQEVNVNVIKGIPVTPEILKKNGWVMCFGWNTNGLGKNRGFEMTEILIVAHGGSKNDTLCTLEYKL